MTKSSDARKQRRKQRRFQRVKGGGQPSKPPPLQYREALMVLTQQCLAKGGIKDLRRDDAAIMLLRCAAKAALDIGVPGGQFAQVAATVYVEEASGDGKSG